MSDHLPVILHISGIVSDSTDKAEKRPLDLIDLGGTKPLDLIDLGGTKQILVSIVQTLYLTLDILKMFVT